MKFFPRKATGYASLLLLVIVAVWIYQPVGTYDFMSMDDPEYVQNNIHVQRGLSGQAVSWAFRTFHMGYWIPLTWLSFMADVELFGFSPAVFHISNLCMHIVASLLLLAALAGMTGRWWPSFTVALLFAVHPIHVESVVWITERKDVLSTLFWMLSLWSYRRYVRAPGLLPYLGVTLFFVLGLMTKPILVTLPVTLLLLDYWPFGRLDGGRPAARRDQGPSRPDGRVRVVAEKIPLFLIAAVFGVLAFSTQLEGGAVKSIGQFSMASRLANALVSSVLYLGKTIWPAHLAVFYPHPGEAISVWKTLAAGLSLTAIGVLVVALRRSHPYLLMGWLWYLTTLFPVSGVFQSGLQGMADRFVYVPGIGLFIAASWGVGETLTSRFRKRLLPALVAAFSAVGFAVAATGQVRYWRSGVELFSHALDTTAPNDYTHMHLGAALWKEGRDREAIEHFQKGLAINPSSPWLHHNMGLAMQRQGRLKEAKHHYGRAVDAMPDMTLALNNLAILLENEGRLDEARRYYERAIAAAPDSPEAHFNLGILLLKVRDLGGAGRAFERALEIDPSDADAPFYLGVVAMNQGDVPKAKASFENALARNPGHAEARYHLGLARLRAGDLRQAAQAFEETLRLKPDHAGARYQMALLGPGGH